MWKSFFQEQSCAWICTVFYSIGEGYGFGFGQGGGGRVGGEGGCGGVSVENNIG